MLNKHKTYFIALVIILIILSFLYGVMVGAREYPAYIVLQKAYRFIISADDDKLDMYNEIDPLFLLTDVDSLIRINDEQDVIEKRENLIQYIWVGKGFPDSKQPDNIKIDVEDERYSDLENLKSIDEIVINLDYDLNSIVYHFHPIKSNNKLIIYHEGHYKDFIVGNKTIQFFLDKGYSVMAFSMPLAGMNNRPIVDLEYFGKVQLTSHDHFMLLESDETRPVKFFLEPIAVALNYAEQLAYEDIFMTGISGGGWTTTVYSAIDPRISKSYPVAGSLPIYLRSNPRWDWGDYEQEVIELYEIANYLELYVLGSYGDTRGQLQILNKYDSCCFGGVKYRTYELEVQKKMSKLGKGTFKVHLDETHEEHKISDFALNAIVKDMETYE